MPAPFVLALPTWNTIAIDATDTKPPREGIAGRFYFQRKISRRDKHQALEGGRNISCV
jgi:hypothetical protein